jgi:hypothetical protein
VWFSPLLVGKNYKEIVVVVDVDAAADLVYFLNINKR